MDINRKWPVNSENNGNIPEFSIIPKILVFFRTGVSNLIFGKIFGNFREIFGHSKPLFYFGPVSDLNNFWLSRYFNIVRLSTVENISKIYRGFERPKLSQNLPKIFPKIRFETPVRKYTVIFGIFENSGIFSLFSLFTGHLRLTWRSFCQITYIPKTHSKLS